MNRRLKEGPRKRAGASRSGALSSLAALILRMARHRFTLPAVLLIGVALPPLIVVGCLEQDRRAAPAFGPSPRLPAPAFAADASKPLDRTIRVRLNGLAGTTTLSVAIDNSYVVLDAATGQILEDSAQATATRTVSTAVESPEGIRWGESVLLANEVRIRPTYDGTLVVNGRRYRGGLFIRRTANRVRANNELDIESYLRGVLIGELPATFHPEAFAAQAVAARTYVLYQKLRYGGDRDYDVLPDERSQMYVGVAGEKNIAINAVERTHGQICTLPDAEGGGIFCTYYSSCCGGQTQAVSYVKPADPAVSPLAGGVACATCTGAKYYTWPAVRIAKAELTRRLAARYAECASLGGVKRVDPEMLLPNGRIIRLRIIGGNGRSVSLVAEDFRLAVGGRTLKSTWCKVQDDGDAVVFTDGRGFGHGMGLCQYGADGMARAGRNHREILAFYYPGCVLKELP